MLIDIPENSFEVLVMNEGLSIRRFPNGIYQVRQVNHRWRYWQAREEIAETEKTVLLSRIETLKTKIQSLEDALEGKRARKRARDNKPPIAKKIDFTVLTPQYLREHLSYDPESGVMSWLKPCSSKSRVVIGRQAGGITSRGYWQIKLGANSYLVSRLAFLYMTGEWPINVVDHIDRNPHNNRWSNLRDVTQSENNRNKATPIRKSKLDPIFRGVYRSGSKWVVIIRIKGRPTYLGQFASRDEAAKVAAPYFADIQPWRDEKMYQFYLGTAKSSVGQFDGQGDHHTPKPYVRRAFRKYLECGIFAHGFAWAWCDECGHDDFGINWVTSARSSAGSGLNTVHFT